MYSTCSIYEEENEYVVKEVLGSAKNFQLVSAVDKLNLKQDSIDPIGGKCLRMTSEKDLTHGFFIAVFERTDFNEEKQETGSQIDKAITKIIGEDSLADNDVDGAENEWETRYLNSIDGNDKIRKQRKRHVLEILSSTKEASLKSPITSTSSFSQKEKGSEVSLVSSYIVSETQVTRVKRRKVTSLTSMENESSSSSTRSQKRSNPGVTILDDILDQVIIVKKKSKSNKSSISSETSKKLASTDNQKSDLEYQATKKRRKSKDCQSNVKHNTQHDDEEQTKQLNGSKKLKLDEVNEITNRRNKQNIKNTESKIEKPKKKSNNVKGKTNRNDATVALPEFLKSHTTSERIEIKKTKKKNKVNEISNEPSGSSEKQKCVDGGVKQKLADNICTKEVVKLKKKTKKRSSSKDSDGTDLSGITTKHKSKKLDAESKADNKRAK